MWFCERRFGGASARGGWARFEIWARGMAGARILEIVLWRTREASWWSWRWLRRGWTTLRGVLEILVWTRRCAVARDERLIGAFCFAGFWFRLVRAALYEGAAGDGRGNSQRGDSCCCWRHQTWASCGGGSRLRCLADLRSSRLNHSAQGVCFGVGQRAIHAGGQGFERQVADSYAFDFFDRVAGLEQAVAQLVAAGFGERGFVPGGVFSFDARDAGAGGLFEGGGFVEGQESF